MAVWKRLASQSATLFVARVCGAGLTFIAQAAIARSWGSVALGNYLLIIATVNLIAVVMPLGFETVGTYFAAEYRAKGEGRLLRGFLSKALFDAGLSVAMSKHLSLTTSFENRYDNRPAAGLKNSDTTFVTGVSLRFD